MKLVRHIHFLIFMLFSSSTFSQGNVDGFFKAKGESNLAFSGSYSGSTKYFRTNGTIDYNRSQLILGAFGIYGITDKFNAILSLPLINFKPQDASIFTKYRLIHHTSKKSDFTLAPALGISFPMSNYQTQSGQAIGQKATIIQPKLVMQFKHFKNWFIQAQGGYSHALNPVPSSVGASVKIGYIYKKWYFDTWFDYQFGIGGTDYGIDSPDFRTLGVSYNRIGGVVYRNIGEKSGLFLNSSYILSGRNIGNAITISTGYVIKLKTAKKNKA